jgi:DNA-binding beta-propeller fold protein YncE
VIKGSSYGFDLPGAVSSDRTHVWVANGLGDSVTELNAATGALVQVITGSSYGFDLPDAVSSDGTDVWVANADQSVTGFPA